MMMRIMIIYYIYNYLIILLVNDIHIYIQESKELSNERGGTICFIGYELSIVEQNWDQ